MKHTDWNLDMIIVNQSAMSAFADSCIPSIIIGGEEAERIKS